MIVIRHLTGPLAGQEQRFADDRTTIAFGRDPGNDVVFPPDAAIVSRRHFALTRKGAHWVVDLFGDPFVALNDSIADVGEPVHGGAKFELGRRGGPSFVVLLDDAPGRDGLVDTLPQERFAQPHEAAAHADAAARRARRQAGWAKGLAAIGLALALLAGGSAYWIHVEKAAAEKRFNDELAALGQRQQEAARRQIPREHRERLRQAAYIVLQRDANGGLTPAGSAVVIGPNLLGTNAHVAKIREGQKPGQSLVVRGPGEGGLIRTVIEHRIHPGYKALQDFLDADPLLVQGFRWNETDSGWRRVNASNSGAYDVATLTVDGPPMAPIIEIASPEELQALAPGDPLAYAGYPVEAILGREVQQIAPTPNEAAGAVLALTDMFMLPTDRSKARYVHHNMGTAGGASGSPIIGASGRLVALHNSGNYLPGDLDGSRVNSGASINYGQRADFLAELVAGKAEENLPAERAYWEKQAGNFKRGADVLIPMMVADNSPRKGAKPTKLDERKLPLSSGEPVKYRDSKGREVASRRITETPKIREGARNTLIAYADGGTMIKLYLLVDGKITEKREGWRWYGAISLDAVAGKKYELVITGPDSDRAVTLTSYAWEPAGS